MPTIIALAILALALPAGAAAQGGDGIVTHQSGGAGAAADGDWSRAQMRAAEPRSILRAPGGEPQAAPARTAGGADGPPGSIDGRPPLGGGPVGEPDPQPRANRFGPFTSGPVGDPTLYPQSTWGKVFGRIPRIGRFTCSATVVHARNRSVVFTAGHCVKARGRNGWVRQLTFVPAYEDGARPFGQWGWRKILIRRQWSRRQNSNFDYAAVVLRRSRGRRVEDVVGSLGFAYNQPRRQTYRAIGYPFNRRGGEGMWECVSKFGGRDPLYRRPGPAPIGIGCDMLGGASGGGWSIRGNRLASVTSFGFGDRPNQLYGPYLTKRAENLRRHAARG